MIAQTALLIGQVALGSADTVSEAMRLLALSIVLIIANRYAMHRA